MTRKTFQGFSHTLGRTWYYSQCWPGRYTTFVRAPSLPRCYLII